MAEVNNQIKASKRKSNESSNDCDEAAEISTIKKQKHKTWKNPHSSEEEDVEIREPTAEELIESTKAENSYSIQSLRSKQKAKHEQNVEHKKSKNKLQNQNQLEVYLKNWKNDRPNWKYKKLLQIEIVSKMFDEAVINQVLWPIVVEYLSGSEGKAKNRIIEKAEEKISKLDEEIEKGKKDLLKSVMYSRARELVQILN